MKIRDIKVIVASPGRSFVTAEIMTDEDRDDFLRKHGFSKAESGKMRMAMQKSTTVAAG